MKMRNKNGQTLIEFVADSPFWFSFWVAMTLQGIVVHFLVLLHFALTKQWWALAFFTTLTLFLISLLPTFKRKLFDEGDES